MSSESLYINIADVSYFPSGKVELEFIWPLKYGRESKLFFLSRCPRGEFNLLTNKAEEIFKLVQFYLSLNNKVSDGKGSVSPTWPISVRPQDEPNSLSLMNTRTFPVQPIYIFLNTDMIFANSCGGVTFH